jgi:hypothetical protein
VRAAVEDGIAVLVCCSSSGGVLGLSSRVTSASARCWCALFVAAF